MLEAGFAQVAHRLEVAVGETLEGPDKNWCPIPTSNYTNRDWLLHVFLLVSLSTSPRHTSRDALFSAPYCFKSRLILKLGLRPIASHTWMPIAGSVFRMIPKSISTDMCFP